MTTPTQEALAALERLTHSMGLANVQPRHADLATIRAALEESGRADTLLREAIGVLWNCKDACTYGSEQDACEGLYGLPANVLTRITLMLADPDWQRYLRAARAADGG